MRATIISGKGGRRSYWEIKDGAMLLHIYAKQIWSEATSRQRHKRKCVAGKKRANIWSKLRRMSLHQAFFLIFCQVCSQETTSTNHLDCNVWGESASCSACNARHIGSLWAELCWGTLRMFTPALWLNKNQTWIIGFHKRIIKVSKITLCNSNSHL